MQSNDSLPSTTTTTPWHTPPSTTNTTVQPLCDLTGPSTYAFTTALLLLSIIGTAENALVLVAMCKNKILRTPSTVLVGALATIDLLTSVIVIPLYVVITLQVAHFALFLFLSLSYLRTAT